MAVAVSLCSSPSHLLGIKILGNVCLPGVCWLKKKSICMLHAMHISATTEEKSSKRQLGEGKLSTETCHATAGLDPSVDWSKLRSLQ